MTYILHIGHFALKMIGLLSPPDTLNRIDLLNSLGSLKMNGLLFSFDTLKSIGALNFIDTFLGYVYNYFL